MSKGKFLFLIYSLRGGGAERVTTVLCSQLVKKGYEVHLGVYQKTEEDYPLDQRVKVYVLEEKKYNSKIRNSISRIRQVKNLVCKIRPDFIVAFMGSVLLESRIATLFKKIVYISAVRIDPAQKTCKKIDRYMMLLTNFLSTAVFVQNKMQKQYYPKFMQKKIFVVFNPVSPVFLDNIHKASDGIQNLVTSGRLTTQKNHKMLIEAINLVQQKVPSIRLTIYGEGPLKKELEGHIDKKNMSENIILYGHTNNMMKELNRNDMFILSSNYEGMPNVLLEAMALGMPCISTDCRTGPSEMIDSYENGILVPVNDVEKMAEAILYMIDNPLKAYDMGKKARNFVQQNCTVDTIAEEFIYECEKRRKKVS